jgi:hypothetical protein
MTSEPAREKQPVSIIEREETVEPTLEESGTEPTKTESGSADQTGLLRERLRVVRQDEGVQEEVNEAMNKLRTAWTGNDPRRS